MGEKEKENLRLLGRAAARQGPSILGDNICKTAVYQLEQLEEEEAILSRDGFLLSRCRSCFSCSELLVTLRLLCSCFIVSLFLCFLEWAGSGPEDLDFACAAPTGSLA